MFHRRRGRWPGCESSHSRIPILVLVAYNGSLGIPFPITLVIMAAGASARAGLTDPWQALLACVIGAGLADHSEYLLGRIAQPWLQLRFGEHPAWRQADATMLRQGNWAILLTRFWLTPLTPAVNVIAGGRYPYARFLVFDLIGELLWVLLYGGLGYLFTAQLQQASQVMSLFSMLSVAAVVAAYGVFWLAQRRSAVVARWALPIREKNNPMFVRDKLNPINNGGI